MRFAPASMMGEARHLVERFLASVVARPPEPADEAWLLGMLNAAEADLYRAQSDQDRAHSVHCGRAARQALGARATPAAVVASALHDVGKTDAGLGTVGRVLATLAGAAVPAGRLEAWRTLDGLRGRIGAYLHHDEHGAELLAGAGSDPLVVRWAAEHHWPPDEWTIDPLVGTALAAADRDVPLRRPRSPEQSTAR